VFLFKAEDALSSTNNGKRETCGIVLVLAGIELIFFPVAAVFWI